MQAPNDSVCEEQVKKVMTAWQTTFQAMILEVILSFYMMPSHASNVKIWGDQ